MLDVIPVLRWGPDTLLEVCRAHAGDAAEAATRGAPVLLLHEFQLMLEAGAAKATP